jgi:alpha-galactosidase
MQLMCSQPWSRAFVFALMVAIASPVAASDALPVPEPRSLPDNGLARTPPMGWNSWNHFAGRITDADVRAMADAMVTSGMKDAGYVYVNIDDTWEGKRNAADKIQSNEKFPDMKALADYVHAKGLKLGIYSSPGPTTCAKFEGSYGHELQDATTYAAWGIDYLKYDYCGAGDVYPLTLANQRGVFQKMGEALAKVSRPIVYSLSLGNVHEPWKWGAGTGANLWRTTDDIKDNWTSMEHNGFFQLAITGYSKPGHWNDPDMLEVGNGGMTTDEYRTHMSLWAMLSAPLLAGNDLRTMTGETKSILLNREVIAVDQETKPRAAYRVDTHGDLDVIARPMNDGSMVVGLFNRGEGNVETTFDLAAIHGLDSRNIRLARDLWSHTAVAVDQGRVAVHIPRHGVFLLRIDAKT